MPLKFMGHDTDNKITNQGVNNEVHVSNEVHIRDDDLLFVLWALFVLILLIVFVKVFKYYKSECQRSIIRRVTSQAVMANNP